MVKVTRRELEKIRRKFSNVYAHSTRHHIFVEPRRDILSWLTGYRSKH